MRRYPHWLIGCLIATGAAASEGVTVREPDSLLGIWSGYYVGAGSAFRNGIWFTLDEVRNGIAHGQVTRALDGAMYSQRITCDNATVTMEPLPGGMVELRFDGPQCKGGREFLLDGNSLAGPLRFGAYNTTVEFSRE